MHIQFIHINVRGRATFGKRQFNIIVLKWTQYKLNVSFCKLIHGTDQTAGPGRSAPAWPGSSGTSWPPASPGRKPGPERSGSRPAGPPGLGVQRGNI